MNSPASMQEHQIVNFSLGKEEYGIDILQVQEINRPEKVTHIPNSPDFVEGVINHKVNDTVIPIINLRRRFNLDDQEVSEHTRVIIISVNNKYVGLKVDSVQEVIRLEHDQIDDAPDFISENIDRKYINGIAKYKNRLIILLDTDKIFSESEKSSLENI